MGKEIKVEVMRDAQISRARELINDNESVTQETFPYAELAWEKIANLPKAERRGGGIPKEQWEERSAAAKTLTEKQERMARNFMHRHIVNHV